MTILIICLWADLSVTVAALLHIVRSTPRTIHHLLYYYELCISLVYEPVHACVVSQVGCEDCSRRMLMDIICHRLLTVVHFVVIIDCDVVLSPEDTQAQTWTSLINPREACGHIWMALTADCYALALFNFISDQYEAIYSLWQHILYV